MICGCWMFLTSAARAQTWLRTRPQGGPCSNVSGLCFPSISMGPVFLLLSNFYVSVQFLGLTLVWAVCLLDMILVLPLDATFGTSFASSHPTRLWILGPLLVR